MAKPQITAADLNGSGEPVSPRRALLSLTAKDLQHLMSSGSLTSENLVHDCLQQIDFFDRDGAQLHAMISVAPREKLLARARELDLERQDGRIRGPLHGIPIILKVTRMQSHPSQHLNWKLWMLTLAGYNRYGSFLATSHNTGCQGPRACLDFRSINTRGKGCCQILIEILQLLDASNGFVAPAGRFGHHRQGKLIRVRSWQVS